MHAEHVMVGNSCGLLRRCFMVDTCIVVACWASMQRSGLNVPDGAGGSDDAYSGGTLAASASP